MVEECRSALVGVGATIAPRSHVWNGICAAFVIPANASRATGKTNTPAAAGSATAAFAAVFQKHAEQARLALKTKPENCRLEREAAQHVHDDLAECVVDGFFGLREADEQERAQRGDFPKPCKSNRLSGKHNVVHGGKEREHEREEPRTAVFLLGVMRLEIFHVAKRVHANARANDTQDEHHNDAERIDMHLAFELYLALNIVFKPQRGKNWPIASTSGSTRRYFTE